jgi:outer membrane receptor protein involved in Fe transport
MRPTNHNLFYDSDTIFHLKSFSEMYVWALARQDRLSPGDIKDIRIPEGGTPGWTTMNFRCGIHITKNLIIIVSLENLFNIEYKYHGSGIFSPGRQLVVSLNYR